MIKAAAGTGKWREEQTPPRVRRHQLPLAPTPRTERSPQSKGTPSLRELLGSLGCPAGHGGHGRDLRMMQVEAGTQNTKPLENRFHKLHCSRKKKKTTLFFLLFWQQHFKTPFTVTFIYASV